MLKLVYVMKKWLIMFFALFLFSLTTVLAGSVDDDLQKVTHYAEEYEVGNINYVQLMVYLSSVRENFCFPNGAVQIFICNFARSVV